MWLGLARRRSVILPSWKGWLILMLLLASLCGVFLKGAYPYLAPDSRHPYADVVIVEGWVSDHIVAQAKSEFDEGRCEIICTAGVDLDKGNMLLPWKDWAIVAAETLKKSGVPEDKILVASAGSQQRHRTYLGFEAAKKKLAVLEIARPLKINVISEGPHGRRSSIVARKIFGDEAIIGMILVEPQAYDPKRWWASSSGTKSILMELVASSYEIFANSGRQK